MRDDYTSLRHHLAEEDTVCESSIRIIGSGDCTRLQNFILITLLNLKNMTDKVRDLEITLKQKQELWQPLCVSIGFIHSFVSSIQNIISVDIRMILFDVDERVKRDIYLCEQYTKQQEQCIFFYNVSINNSMVIDRPWPEYRRTRKSFTPVRVLPSGTRVVQVRSTPTSLSTHLKNCSFIIIPPCLLYFTFPQGRFVKLTTWTRPHFWLLDSRYYTSKFPREDCTPRTIWTNENNTGTVTSWLSP